MADSSTVLDRQLLRQYPEYVKFATGNKLDTGVPRDELPSSWLFQSTPDRFNLEGALAELQELAWTVNQSKNEIRAGDWVYLWETGSDARVAGYGVITTTPPELEEDIAESQFWLKTDAFQGARLRVRIHVEGVLDPPIRRDDVKNDPVLRDLPNLKFANATNYKLSHAQSGRLAELVGLGALAPAMALADLIPQHDFWLVAYFLSRCGVKREGDWPAPPAQLKAGSWGEALERFFPVLGRSRDVTTFHNSLKGARDAFDANTSYSGRVGWRQKADDAGVRAPTRLSPLAEGIMNAWANRTDEESLASGRPIRDLPGLH